MLFYCTTLFIIVPLYFGDFAECSSGSRGLGWGVAQAELCQLSPCTTALHAQLWCPKRQLWGDKDLETPSSPPDPEVSPLPAQLILGPFSSFVFRVLTTKEMANELKLEGLFPGEVSCCSQSPPAETAVGRSHLAAGPALRTQGTADPTASAMKLITSYHWGQLLCNPEGIGHHKQWISSALPPQKCFWANSFCEILFSSADRAHKSFHGS